MTQHPPGLHLSTCTGPDNCAEYKALLSMSTTAYSKYLQKQDEGIRHASTRGQLRALGYDPPDPYAAGIKQMRAADNCLCVRLGDEVTPDFDPNYDVSSGVAPNGHGIHIALRQLAAEPRDAPPLSADERAMLGAYADGVAAMRGATK